MALPRFGGKPEQWPDFGRGFKAILVAFDPAIEMVRLPEAASRLGNRDTAMP